MPTVTLNRRTFETLVGKKLPEDELKDRISMLGTDLDTVSSEEIIVEIFPNRPDMLSEQGFARAFSAFIGEKPGLIEYKIGKSGQTVTVDEAVKDVRPRIACAIVRGLTITEESLREIIQIQEKLHTTFGRNRKKCAIGIYPLEAIKLPILYTAKAPKDIIFLALEDTHEKTADKIIAEHPTGQKYGPLLEGLKQYPVFYDGAGKVLSLPPIINSDDTGRVLDTTKDVFVECSGFEQHVVSKCLNMIITALADMGGNVESMDIKYHDGTVTTPDLTPSSMDLDLDYVNKRLGLKLDNNAVGLLLSKMGHSYDNGKVKTPAWRDDIMHPLDLVEDVAIAYGYENFIPTIPQVATIGMEAPFEVFKRKIIELLVGMGLLECNTYHIVNEETQQSKMKSEIPLVKLANALNEEYTVVRAWMMPCLMEILSNNKHHSYPQNIFDAGVVFKANSDMETGVEEFERLAVVFAHETADYTQARQCLEYIFRNFAVEGAFKEVENDSFIPGRVARVSVSDVDLAYCGEIAPEVLSNFDLQVPVSGFELNLTALFKLLQ